MREWNEKHKAGGGLLETIGDIFAAAEAGDFAVSQDTGDRIMKQLTEVQDRVAEMRNSGTMVAGRTRLGGGFAEQMSTFNQRVNEDGGQNVLVKFAEELELLKNAISKSIASYQTSDTDGRQNINRAGGA
jgi:hypothetical protein